jgi:trehalose synthase-fused probable maltokinase
VSEAAQPIASTSLGLPPERALTELVRRERWFGARSRTVRGGRVVDAANLGETEHDGLWVLYEIDFADGGADVYQLLCAPTDTRELADLSLAPGLVRLLVARLGTEACVDGITGRVAFHADEIPRNLEAETVESVGGEQSNSSVALGQRAILKIYRRLEGGPSPELELLRFLHAHGFAHAPRLLGWYDYEGQRFDSTLGVLQEYARGESDGWNLVLESLASDPQVFVTNARRLGEVTGAMHTVLASDRVDPQFQPERLDAEALAELSDSVESEVHEVFDVLPSEHPALDVVRARRADVLERLRTLRELGAFGVVIRHHGDFHLGQVLWTGDDWLVLDFEGEPARTLEGRRRKRSPFRDVAGMLRSFAYAAETSRAQSVPPPRGWEERVRREFLDGYLSTVEPSLLPASDEARAALLAAFELEKAVYELRYELDNRPDWIGVPVAGILRTLEVPAWR